MLELIISLSLHVGMGDDYNSVHPQIRWNQDDYIAGVYLNSHTELSAFVGHRWEIKEVGFEFGLVTGYNVAPIVPFFKVDYNGFYLAPAIHEGDVGAIFGYEWTF
tara:strand:- start:236 stop:550 length:315 start_codon:yes stop_codon:yes gene_type:complete